MTTSKYGKPLPRPREIEKPYWDGLKKHEIWLQKCRDCGQIWFPPHFGCPKCLSTNWDWVRASGKGKVWSWGVFYQLYFKSFAQDIPYNVVQVTLDEGPDVISNMVECKNEDIKCDMRVEAVFDDVTPEVTLLKFKPAKQ